MSIEQEDCPAALRYCEYYHYRYDKNGQGDICYCSHPENKEDTEGNCFSALCPLVENEEPIEIPDVIRNQDQLNIELRQELAETKAKLEKARTVLKEADAYLDINSYTNIGNGSSLHREFKQLLKELEND